MNKSEEEEEEEHIVTFEEFSKIHLKIGKIIQAEIIAGMEKILKVKVDVGIDQRDLVVGAALFYRPEPPAGCPLRSGSCRSFRAGVWHRDRPCLRSGRAGWRC